MSETLELAMDLIARASVTPQDAGCQETLIWHLQSAGFVVERLPFGPVSNFWARRGTSQPLLAFAGHTDVVPAGPLEQWHSPPFQASLRDGHLFGRGAADMKGSIAAMVTATEHFVAAHPDHKGSIAFLITSDEEGPSTDGTVKVLEHLKLRHEKIDWCIVGEPSSGETLGDTIKNGRRGSLTGKLIIYGKQGHVAYPHLAANPVHLAASAVAELCAIVWDQGNRFFPPTTFQIVDIHAGTGVYNVIPGQLHLSFNFRFSTEQTPDTLKQRVEALLKSHSLEYELEWHLGGEPFLTEEGELVAAVRSAIEKITGLDTRLSTAGGTSDGRFISAVGAQVVELGPVNATIHQIDECVRVEDLETLSLIYQKALEHLLL